MVWLAVSVARCQSANTASSSHAPHSPSWLFHSSAAEPIRLLILLATFGPLPAPYSSATDRTAFPKSSDRRRWPSGWRRQQLVYCGCPARPAEQLYYRFAIARGTLIGPTTPESRSAAATTLLPRASNLRSGDYWSWRCRRQGGHCGVHALLSIAICLPFASRSAAIFGSIKPPTAVSAWAIGAD